MTGDPWREALDKHIATDATKELPVAGDPGGPAGGRRVPNWLLVLAVGAIAVLVVAGAYVGFLAVENHNRADRWRDRATATQGLVDSRTKALNRQTARLNVASTRLRATRQAVERSEQDVDELASRQRELAAEKAQVEDRRAALELQGTDLAEVASQLTFCRDDLVGLVNTYAQGLTPSAGEYERAASSCDAADATINDYVAKYSTQ
jgi:hypothetical protein